MPGRPEAGRRGRTGSTSVGRVRFWRALIGLGLPAALLGVGVAWALANPAGPQISAVTSATAVVIGVVVFGFAWLPVTVGAAPRSVAAPIAIAAMAWAIAAFLTSWIEVSLRTGRSLIGVSVGDFVTVSADGLPSLITTFCALAAACWSAWVLLGTPAAAREAAVGPELAGALAAVGIAVGPATGHLSQHPAGSIIVAVHALAAAWWCGSLAAIALIARGRRDWAQLLPAFSRRAPAAVVALALSGVVATVLEVTSLHALIDTGYGRLIIAKIAGLVILLVLAWWHRTRWTPRAADHRAAESDSLRHAVAETCLMATILGVAAALATTAAQ